ncbi:MAG: AsnC family transcriptional regulator [Desulfobulbus propionicus]|nr:MAG: AsnC family transcriptional regulator [Desulfobulbus propionicus]
MPKHTIDETDSAILNLLQEDGRASNVKLAEILNLSETPCWRRLKRLEEEGYIQSYQAHLDRKKLDLGVIAFVELSFSTHAEETLVQFEQAVQDIPEVLFCHNISGASDYLLQVVTENLESYELLSRNVIRRLPGVTSMKTSFSLKEIKASTKLPISLVGNPIKKGPFG